MAAGTIDRSEIIRLFGDIEDHKVVEILKIGAAHSELEEVAAWLVEEDDVMGELRRPLTGRAAHIYETVRREDDEVDEDSARR